MTKSGAIGMEVELKEEENNRKGGLLTKDR